MKRIRRALLRWITTCFPHLWPVAALIVLCGVFFWDALWLPTGSILGGEDLTNLFVPWLRLVVSSVHQGQLPLWNPYSFSGTPLVANPQVALFYPPTWLAAVMPVNRALSVTAVLHLWIAGVGMYAWLQSEGASRSGALLAAVVLAFSGYFLVRVRGGHLGVVTTGSWLPLLLWVHHRACKRRRWTLAVMGGLPVGLSLLAGHVPSFIYVALGLTAYAAFRAWDAWRRERSLWAASRPLLMGGAMLFVGLALAAVQFLPTAQFVARSARQAAASYDFAARFSWPPGYLLTLLVPNFFGEPTRTGYWGDGIYDEFIFYIGILPLLLALLALKLRHRLLPFLLTMALGALLLAIGQYGILHRLFYRFLPLFRVMRAPARAGYLFTLAAAALAGLSLSALHRSDRPERARLLNPVKWSAALAVAGGALALVVAGFAAFALGREANPAAGRLWHQANQVTLFLCFFLLSVALLVYLKNGKASHANGRIWVLALGLAILDLWTFGNSVLDVRSVQESAYWRIVDQAVLDRETKRVLPWGLEEAEQNGGIVFGLRSVFGYDPLTLQRYEDFITSRSDPRARTYDLLNAGYLVTTARQEFSEDLGEPRLLIEESGVYVYERPTAMSRAWIAPHAELMDGAAVLERIHDPAFDLRETALVEEPVSCAGTGGDVQITYYAGNRIEAETQGGGGILVFSEIDYPGWQATIDGEHAELLRADYVLRAVCVPPGQHNVLLRYAPSLLRIGAVITGLTVLAIAAAAVWSIRRDGGRNGA